MPLRVGSAESGGCEVGAVAAESVAVLGSSVKEAEEKMPKVSSPQRERRYCICRRAVSDILQLQCRL